MIGNDFAIWSHSTDIFGHLIYESSSLDLDVGWVGKIPGTFSPRVEIGFQIPIYSSASNKYTTKGVKRYLETNSTVTTYGSNTPKIGSPGLIKIAIGYDFQISERTSSEFSLFGAFAGKRSGLLTNKLFIGGIKLTVGLK